MEFNVYAKEVEKLAVYPRIGNNLVYPTLGLAGETGEYVEKVKKMMRDDGETLTPERRTAMLKELGDVLWYLTRCSAELGSSLDEVAEMNLAKLRGRTERGTRQGEGDDR